MYSANETKLSGKFFLIRYLPTGNYKSIFVDLDGTLKAFVVDKNIF